jgi:nucleoside-diphosphate-sugar epimerase
MRILVLGGTAFLSAEIVRQAVAAGHQVTCPARGSAADPPKEAAWLKADRSQGARAYDSVQGEWDGVVDVARDPAPAAEALEALAHRTAHWTFVSSCSVYADASVPGAAEDATLLPPLAPGVPSTQENYGASKAAIEEATLRATRWGIKYRSGSTSAHPGMPPGTPVNWCPQRRTGSRTRASPTGQGPIPCRFGSRPATRGFLTRSNKAAVAAGLRIRAWQETLADTLADERRRGLERPRRAGLMPETEARLVGILRAGTTN